MDRIFQIQHNLHFLKSDYSIKKRLKETDLYVVYMMTKLKIITNMIVDVSRKYLYSVFHARKQPLHLNMSRY